MLDFLCFVSYDEKVATETLLKKMDLKNYQVHTSFILEEISEVTACSSDT